MAHLKGNHHVDHHHHHDNGDDHDYYQEDIFNTKGKIWARWSGWFKSRQRDSTNQCQSCLDHQMLVSFEDFENSCYIFGVAFLAPLVLVAPHFSLSVSEPLGRVLNLHSFEAGELVC